MSVRIVHTDKAPAAIGPYSQGVVAGNLLFTAGQIALDPATGQIVTGDVAVQTERVICNLTAVLESAGHLHSEEKKNERRVHRLPPSCHQRPARAAGSGTFRYTPGIHRLPTASGRVVSPNP